jgi:drug/metabolite transporter (DMT)-like permease
MSTENKIIPLAKALFAVVVWGASFIATKVAVGEASPNTIVWIRFAMGVMILGWAVFTRKQFKWITPKELGYFSLLGFLGITFHQWLQSNGLVTAQATTTAWIVATTPIFIAVLGWLVLKERLGWFRVAGIALAALGVLLIVSKGDLNSLTIGKFGTVGDYLVMVSAVNWAVFSVLSRDGLKDHPAARMMFYVMTLGWVFISILFVADSGFNELNRFTASGWTAVIFLGVFCSGIAYIFWYDALQEIPASRLGVLLYIEPLIAVVVAAIILGEAITLPALIGGAVILLGVWMVNKK